MGEGEASAVAAARGVEGVEGVCVAVQSGCGEQLAGVAGSAAASHSVGESHSVSSGVRRTSLDSSAITEPDDISSDGCRSTGDAEMSLACVTTALPAPNIPCRAVGGDSRLVSWSA
ncbi:hypothetical protein SGFS_067940 [Streptomyces graminofaciens]|jgi:hypothetical protein|uniref:Uncharacterized protein n=1 Tax=Streptomyces graminofaciens TaxID=68212 RepID=A0ABM7FGZ3_9ACTN|nr:hypothetical protein SGFS_067940 [Streptomyces graminofaciens]